MRKILKELSDKLLAAHVNHYFSGAPLIEVVRCDKMHQISNGRDSDKKLHEQFTDSQIKLHIRMDDFEKVSHVLGARNVFITTHIGYTVRHANIFDVNKNVQYTVTFAEFDESLPSEHYEQHFDDVTLPLRNLATELYIAVTEDTPWATYHAMQLLHWGFENRFKSVSDFTAYLKECLPYHMYLHLEVKVNTIFNIALYEGIFSDLEIED